MMNATLDEIRSLKLSQAELKRQMSLKLDATVQRLDWVIGQVRRRWLNDLRRCALFAEGSRSRRDCLLSFQKMVKHAAS